MSVGVLSWPLIRCALAHTEEKLLGSPRARPENGRPAKRLVIKRRQLQHPRSPLTCSWCAGITATGTTDIGTIAIGGTTGIGTIAIGGTGIGTIVTGGIVIGY
jgi:hypothetical protein